jgi:hypothetical protein
LNEHCVPLQLAMLALVLPHATPQPPQLSVVLSWVSQPSSAVGATGCVQLPKPATQVEVHTPLVHDCATTLLVEHERVQLPQNMVELPVLVSQPSVLAPLCMQSPKPGLQVNEHCVPLQLAALALFRPHMTPHAPQFPVDESEVSQPFKSGTTLTQSANPGLQPVYMQLPLEQLAPNELVESQSVAVQQLPAAVQNPAAQYFMPTAQVQVLATQVAPAAHWGVMLQQPPVVILAVYAHWREALQVGAFWHALAGAQSVAGLQHAASGTHALPHSFCPLVERLVSQPSEATPLQSAKPGLHMKVQAPALQLMLLAFITDVVQLTRVPHAVPQVAGALRLVSQPFDLTPSQSANGAEQVVYVHAPVPSHEMPLALATVLLQLVAQAPQWSVAVSRLVSQPSSAVGAAGCVQLPNGELQVELQRPPMHDTLATLVPEHERVQPPQWMVSVLRLISQPLLARPSQSAKPGLHTKVQVPAEQPMVFAFNAAVLQLTAAPQVAPQVATAFRLVSQPLAVLPSQSPNGAVQFA